MREFKKPISSSSQSKKINQSNKAVNKLEDQKETSENSKQIQELTSQIIQNENNEVSSNEINDATSDIEINNPNKELFDEINAFINKKQYASIPKNSSFQYELKNRTLLSYKSPAYQCQEAGT